MTAHNFKNSERINLGRVHGQSTYEPRRKRTDRASNFRSSRRCPSASCVRARTMPMKKPVVTEALLDDIFHCADWVDQNHILVRNVDGKPMFVLTPERIHWALSKATACLNATMGLNGPRWSIEDLIAPDNFLHLCKWCSEYDAIRTLIQIAADWVCVPAATLASMEDIARSMVPS